MAVLDEAMVARARNQVESTGDPTAHAVMVVLREAARRLGRTKLSGMIIFSAHEPCTMCVGALLECDVDGLVFALADPDNGAAGSSTRLPQTRYVAACESCPGSCRPRRRTWSARWQSAASSSVLSRMGHRA